MLRRVILRWTMIAMLICLIRTSLGPLVLVKWYMIYRRSHTRRWVRWKVRSWRVINRWRWRRRTNGWRRWLAIIRWMISWQGWPFMRTRPTGGSMYIWMNWRRSWAQRSWTRCRAISCKHLITRPWLNICSRLNNQDHILIVVGRRSHQDNWKWPIKVKLQFVQTEIFRRPLKSRFLPTCNASLSLGTPFSAITVPELKVLQLVNLLKLQKILSCLPNRIIKTFITWTIKSNFSKTNETLHSVATISSSPATALPKRSTTPKSHSPSLEDCSQTKRKKNKFSSFTKPSTPLISTRQSTWLLETSCKWTVEVHLWRKLRKKWSRSWKRR